MQLGFFTMPMHPPGRNYTQTLKEDRAAVILADRLGYSEAFIGEHATDICESIPSCLAFIASLAHGHAADQARQRHAQSAQRSSGADRGQRGDDRPPARRALPVRHRSRRAALGHGNVRQPRARPQRDVRRVDRSHPRAVERRAAVQPARANSGTSPPSRPCCRRRGRA